MLGAAASFELGPSEGIANKGPSTPSFPVFRAHRGASHPSMLRPKVGVVLGVPVDTMFGNRGSLVLLSCRPTACASSGRALVGTKPAGDGGLTVPPRSAECAMSRCMYVFSIRLQLPTRGLHASGSSNNCLPRRTMSSLIFDRSAATEPILRRAVSSSWTASSSACTGTACRCSKTVFSTQRSSDKIERSIPYNGSIEHSNQQPRGTRARGWSRTFASLLPAASGHQVSSQRSLLSRARNASRTFSMSLPMSPYRIHRSFRRGHGSGTLGTTEWSILDRIERMSKPEQLWVASIASKAGTQKPEPIEANTPDCAVAQKAELNPDELCCLPMRNCLMAA